jgi:mono/diheme cytochrome c family protein
MLLKIVFKLILIGLCSFSFQEKNLNTEFISTKKKSINLKQTTTKGKEVYIDFCIQCHLGNGKGTSNLIPPLDGSNWLKDKRKESIYAVKFGQKGIIYVNGKKYNRPMPPMGLTDQEVADVMNYIMTNWSNKNTKKVTLAEVAAIKM